jgi:hypothetical protein
MVNDFKVDIKIKERTANFFRPVDVITNVSPEKAVQILSNKYSEKKVIQKILDGWNESFEYTASKIEEAFIKNEKD